MAKGRREKLRQEADTSRELAQRLEVRSIKRYAIIRAYILKAMKLLGSLALLWSTVVLLGGFVTLLKGIDFWLLTFIGFIQAAGAQMRRAEEASFHGRKDSQCRGEIVGARWELEQEGMSHEL
ncbi:hypothetical protein EJB05_30666, partial [Eragrostis curvula]